MQIPKDLPQFELRKTFIVVSGTHEVRFIGAYKGDASELHDYKVEKITYSDREGHFLRRAFGKVLGSGSVYEPKKKHEMIEFLTEFEKQTEKVLKAINPDEIILMAPDYAMPEIKKKIPATYQKEVRYEIAGNFIKKRLPAILKILKKETFMDSTPTPTSEEAKKILEKGR